MKNQTRNKKSDRTERTGNKFGSFAHTRQTGYVTVMIDGAEHSLNLYQAESLGVIEKVQRYNLSITAREAAALDAVLSRIGGSMEGPRGLTESVLMKVRDLVEDAGNLRKHSPDTDLIGAMIDREHESSGYIYFKG